MGRYSSLVRDSYRVAKVVILFWVYVVLLMIGSAGKLLASGVKQVFSGVGRVVGWGRPSTPSRP